MKTKKRKQKTITAIKIQAKPLTEDQIALFVKHYDEVGSFPGSKIPCIITGKLTTCVGPWMKKKIKEFGGPENLLRGYKCRGALKVERQIIKPVRNKRKSKAAEIKTEDKKWDIPKLNFDPPRPMTDTEITEASKSQCFRPDIFLTNGRHCDGCEIYDICENYLKNLPTYDKKKRA